MTGGSQIQIGELQFSRVGLGTAQFGRDQDGWGIVDDNESIATIHSAVEMGINWVDCNPDDGGGHAEHVTGLALQDHRGALRIASRTPQFDRDDAEDPRRRFDLVMHACEASQRRLGVESLDLYTCALPINDALLPETVRVMRTLQERGVIGAVGLSGVDSRALAQFAGDCPLHATSGRFNLLEREASRDVRSWAASNGVAFIGYSPLCRGLLTDKEREESSLHGIRSRDIQFQRPRFGENQAARRRLAELAAEQGVSLVRFAVGWALSRPGVSCVAVGARVVSQLRESAQPIDAGSLESVAQRVEDILQQRDEAIRRVM